MKNTIKTRDLYLASLWYAKSQKFVRVERKDDVCWFIFDNKGQCEEIQRKYFSKEEFVNAKLFVDSIRTLKDLVFSV